MPTSKQKRAFKEVLKGSTISSAMVKAGYSKTTASTTGKLTNSDGWKVLVDKFLPDKDLVKVHKEGLMATTKKPHLIDRDDKGRPIYDYVPEDDYSIRHKYLETAYKIKGKIKNEDTPNVSTIINVQVNKNTLNIINNAEKQLEEEMRKSIGDNGNSNNN